MAFTCLPYTSPVKRILPLAILSVLLASCTPAVIPPAQSVTGYWTGSISKYGMTVNIKAHLKLTDQPKPGDFTGTADLSGIISVSNGTVTGNVNEGTLVASDGSENVTCVGSFKNNNEYNGSCTFRSYGAQLYLSRQGD